MIVSAIVAVVYQFFVFSVDYTRTEYTQFEDDDYYYYVKAVPKVSLSAPDVKIQKINTIKTDQENEKKDVNTNLPANYTFAYKILFEPLTSEEKTQYAEKLVSQYKKYDSQDNISALLLLFAGHLEFVEKINKIRTIYALNDENAVKNLVSKYVSVFEKTDIEFIDKSAGYITEYYNSYPTYLEYVKKYGCVNNGKIDLNCEVDMRRDPQHEDLYDTYIKLSSLEKQIDERRLV